MELITNRKQLIANIETLERYLTNGNEFEKRKALSLVKQGICFVTYKVGDETRFAPSRFIGYIDNTIDKHLANNTKHGTFTNGAIKSILNDEPFRNDELEKKYFEYCARLGIYPNRRAPFDADRKFWKL